jgi:hypothetical protein
MHFALPHIGRIPLGNTQGGCNGRHREHGKARLDLVHVGPMVKPRWLVGGYPTMLQASVAALRFSSPGLERRDSNFVFLIQGIP